MTSTPTTVNVWVPASLQRWDSRLVALRLRSPPSEGSVRADTYGGLADMLSDAPEHAQQPDVDRMDDTATHPCATVGAIVATQSVREAAGRVGIHHNTLSTRVEVISTGISIEVPVHD